MSTERFVRRYARKFSMIACSNHNKYPSRLSCRAWGKMFCCPARCNCHLESLARGLRGEIPAVELAAHATRGSPPVPPAAELRDLICIKAAQISELAAQRWGPNLCACTSPTHMPCTCIFTLRPVCRKDPEQCSLRFLESNRPLKEVSSSVYCSCCLQVLTLKNGRFSSPY